MSHPDRPLLTITRQHFRLALLVGLLLVSVGMLIGSHLFTLQEIVGQAVQGISGTLSGLAVVAAFGSRR